MCEIVVSRGVSVWDCARLIKSEWDEPLQTIQTRNLRVSLPRPSREHYANGPRELRDISA